MSAVTGYVLAGGQSSRMGEDKALLDLGGRTLVERAADALSAVADTVKIVGLRGEYNGRLNVIPDSFDGRGSVVGLYTALADCRTEYAAVLACDLPFVGGELLIELAASIGEHDAAMPKQSDGRLQPLCAVYRVNACLPVVEGILNSNNWRLQALAELLGVRIITPEGERWHTNVNTPAELLDAIELDEKS